MVVAVGRPMGHSVLLIVLYIVFTALHMTHYSSGWTLAIIKIYRCLVIVFISSTSAMIFWVFTQPLLILCQRMPVTHLKGCYSTYWHLVYHSAFKFPGRAWHTSTRPHYSSWFSVIKWHCQWLCWMPVRWDGTRIGFISCTASGSCRSLIIY